MLRYSDDGRYILQYSKTTKKTTRLGPYNENTLPEIKNSDETDRSIKAIPEPNKSAYDLYPNLRNEFIRFTDPKFSNLTLKDVKGSCGFKAEFQCNTCGYKQITTMQHRAKRRQECSHCCKYKISFPEKYVSYCLKQVDTNLQENYIISDSQTLEFDIYDPALKLAIEFSSGRYHSNREDTDKRKLQYAVSQNIRLIRVWQLSSVKQVDRLNKDEYVIPAKSSINGVPDLNIVIDDICEQYKLNQNLIDRQLASNQAFLRTNKIPPAGESFLDQYPDLCRDWDYSKNGVIRPNMIKPAQHIRVYWTCLYCGKTWKVSVDSRTAANKTNRAGCQECNTKIGMGLMQEISYIQNK